MNSLPAHTTRYILTIEQLALLFAPLNHVHITAETLTIAAGVAISTDTASYFIIASESGTDDDLVTLTITGASRLLVLQASSGNAITIKHLAGNIRFNNQADFELTGDKTLVLFWDGVNLSDIGASNDPPITRIVTASESISDDAGIVYLLVDAGAGAVTLNLPAVATRMGKEIIVTKTDNSLYRVIAACINNETINGDIALIIEYQWSSAHLYCTGTEWILI